jgi:exopolysaccharide production protein ExoY
MAYKATNSASIPVNNTRFYTQQAKRLLDLSLAVAGLIVTGPLFAILGVILLVTQGRPIIFKHQRIGVDGAKFDCLKFRTMVVDAERVLYDLLRNDPSAAAEWQANQKLARDPRITRLGNFMRRTSLDELPQLWNVILGDMSIVGPRPIVEDEIPRYKNDFKYYAAVRPGITGLWQTTGRNNCPYPERVALDRKYALNWDVYLDLTIILRTFVAVFSGSR